MKELNKEELLEIAGGVPPDGVSEFPPENMPDDAYQRYLEGIAHRPIRA